MIKVNKAERNALESVGLLRSRKVGYNACDANYTVVNREHLGRSKKTYVTEEPEIMLFLGKYDGMNLQMINESQLKKLQEKGMLNEQNMQRWMQYVPNAIAFQDAFGQWRIKKVTKIMIELGLWKDNRQRRYYNNYRNNQTKQAQMSGESMTENLNAENLSDENGFEDEVNAVSFD